MFAASAPLSARPSSVVRRPSVMASSPPPRAAARRDARLSTKTAAFVRAVVLRRWTLCGVLWRLIALVLSVFFLCTIVPGWHVYYQGILDFSDPNAPDAWHKIPGTPHGYVPIVLYAGPHTTPSAW